MSFDVEDDESMPSFGPTPSHRDKEKDKDGERKKKKKRKEKQEDEDDSMWVEKPAPEVVKNLPLPVGDDGGDGMHVDGEGDAKEVGPQRGRKRAIDFM